MYIIRYIYNLRNKNDKRKGLLTIQELFTTELYPIKKLQIEYFSGEFKNFESEQQFSNSSKMYNLNQFLNHEEALRLGGRLQKSTLSFPK